MASTPYWLKTLFLASVILLGGFGSVLCAVLSVGVSVRSFCSCNACVISLSSLKLFSVSFVCSLFSLFSVAYYS
ncbi:hypothetical protein [Helicobacter pylori]|uniref:hypothetical protein n=1 Tax=Helicobacter pylori TaxID=210 RepID=UPI0009A3904E|nr:hypothetical protein [Helicobacter pylori]OPG37465.1 hypothetical protein BGL64_00010 [Helicobacter pylori]